MFEPARVRSRRRATRRGRLGLAVAALATCGCGAQAAAATHGTTDSRIGSAIAALRAAPGYRVRANAVVRWPGHPTGTSTLTGVVGRDGTVDVTAVSPQRGLPPEIVSEVVTGGAVDLVTSASDGGRRLRLPASASIGLLGPGGLATTVSDPSRLAAVLAALRGRVTDVGTGRIDGTATTGYRTRLDLGALLARVPAEQRRGDAIGFAAVRRHTGAGTVPVELWLDAHQRLRQLRIAFATTLCSSPRRFNLTLDVTRYGPVTISPPAASGLTSGTPAEARQIEENVPRCDAS